jgi:hypothetical protein
MLHFVDLTRKNLCMNASKALSLFRRITLVLRCMFIGFMSIGITSSMAIFFWLRWNVWTIIACCAVWIVCIAIGWNLLTSCFSQIEKMNSLVTLIQWSPQQELDLYIKQSGSLSFSPPGVANFFNQVPPSQPTFFLKVHGITHGVFSPTRPN